MNARRAALLGPAACALGFLTAAVVAPSVASADSAGAADVRGADSSARTVAQSGDRATPRPASSPRAASVTRDAGTSGGPQGRGTARVAGAMRATTPTSLSAVEATAPAPAGRTRFRAPAAIPTRDDPAPEPASTVATTPVSPPPVAASPSPGAGAAATITAAPVGRAVAAAQATAAASGNPIEDFISGIVLIVQQLFFNKGPAAAPTQAMTRPSGGIWGFVAGSDPDDDPITYTVTRGPQFGTVTVTATGVYAYTPGVGFTGTDSFTVTVADPGTPIALLNALSGHSKDVTVTVQASTGNPAGTVVDTFGGAAGSAPDPALWGYHLGPWQDGGLQTYTDSSDNVRLDGQGNLVIQARRSEDGYTSTRLVTQDKLEMQYGVVEARITMPAGQGIWPAFWMLGTSYHPEDPAGWPECGEIDIMELVNGGTRYNVALHGPQGETDYYGGVETGQFVGDQGEIAAVAPISDLTAGYHDYWTMWREDQIVIGVDDTLLGDYTPASLPEGAEWVFNQKMYGILQIAVGGSWAGPPDATTPWPATMLVDSFRYTPLG